MQIRRYQIEWMLLGTVLLVLGALIGYWLYEEHNRVEVQERDRLQVQARVIDENLGRQLEGVNNALAGVRNDFPLSDSKNIGPTVSRRLRALSDAMPGVRTMIVVNADGLVLAASRGELIGFNASEREYFKVPRKRPDPAMLYVSPPFKTALGVYSINVVRVVTGVKGEFAGIVSATLDPDYFNVVLHSVLYAPDMQVAIVHGDGVGFLTMPRNERAAGTDFAIPGSFFARHKDSGQTATVMTGTRYVTGDERMMAVRSIRPANVPMDKPLVVGVSRDLSAIYAPWRKDALMDSALYGAIALTAILGLYFTQRRHRKLDRVAADHERERRESAERLRLALRGGDLGLWDWHVPSGRVIFDECWCAMLGYALEDIKPHVSSWETLDLVHPDDLPVIHAALDPHLKGETPAYESEHRLRHKDGHWVWILDRGKVMERDAAGAPVRIVGTHLDVTVRKRAEESLRESEERLRAIFEGAVDGILVADVRSGIFLTGNPAICRMLGYTLQEFVRLGVSDIHPKQDLAHVIEEFERLQRGESQVVADFPVIRKGGSVFRADMQLAPIRLGVTDCALAIVRDISERKQAAEALRASEAKFRLLAEEDLAGVVIIQDGRFKYVNPAMTRMLGYSREDMLGASTVLDFVAEEDRASVEDKLRLRQDGEVQSAHYFFRCRKTDDSLADLEVFGTRIPFDGRFAVMSTVLDVTKRKRAEQELQRIAAELRKAYRRLAQAQETERHALTKELHDQVGQNLSALNLNLHYIDRELSDAERTRLKGRLDDCLVLLDETVARVRSVMGNLRPPMLDEFGLFATLRWWAHETTQRSGIPCVLVGPDLAQRLPTELESALLRIAQEALMNAAKYSRAHEIRIALTAMPQQVQMEIADDGVGFDPLSRDASVSKPTWGLTSMRERADALGGRVQVLSAPGEGTRVVAEIPREPA